MVAERRQIPWPGALATGRSARGNGGRHLLWVDPARDLVLSSHWTEEPLELIRQVSGSVRRADQETGSAGSSGRTLDAALPSGRADPVGFRRALSSPKDQQDGAAVRSD